VTDRLSRPFLSVALMLHQYIQCCFRRRRCHHHHHHHRDANAKRSAGASRRCDRSPERSVLR